MKKLGRKDVVSETIAHKRKSQPKRLTLICFVAGGGLEPPTSGL